MKRFTKMFMTLALLCMAGVAYAGEEQVIASVDYSQDPVLINGNPHTSEGYPWYRMGDCEGTASFDVVDGVLVIDNTQEQANNWDLQPFILDWFNLQKKYGYRVEVTMKANGEGTANLSIGTWSASDNAGLAFSASSDFVTYSATVESGTVATSGNDAHVLFQCGKFIGTVEIQKVELIEIAPDVPIKEPVWKNIIVNSDLSGSDYSCFFSKEYPSADVVTSTVEDGAIVVNSAAKVIEDWDSQFWIRFPQTLAAGTDFKVSFKCKASVATTVQTQCHNEPGQYIIWHSIGDVNFGTDWDTYSATVTVPGDCDGSDNQGGYTNDFHSIAFNLTKDQDIVYYFKDIVIEVDEDIAENPQPYPGDEPSQPIEIVIPEIPEGYESLAEIPFMQDGNEVQVDQNFTTENGLKTIGAGGVVVGTSTVSAEIYADYSDYAELMVICAKADGTSPEGVSFRMLMNREPQEDGQGPLVERAAVADANGYAKVNVGDLEFVHLNAIKLNWGQPDSYVFYLVGKKKSDVVPVVIPEIPEGYESLAEIPFMKEGEEVQVEQNFSSETVKKIVGAGGVVIGTGTVSADIYADYSDYSELMIICAKADGTSAEGLSFRVLMNREPQEDGQGPLVEKAAVADADGYATVDVSDLDFVHVNAIKANWGMADSYVFYLVGKKKSGSSVKGDVNGDGTVSVSDIVVIANAIAANSQDPKYDVNGDGSVSVSDIVTLANIIANSSN